jgi:xanthine dehydrogenase small subunit
MEDSQNNVQFVLDGKVITVDFEKQNISPTITVLNFLRSLPHHKGVKEGCAEGDCGACTVVIAEPTGNKLHYKTINSCLVFLPMIHGKQLITVENLADSNNQLHPVQKALVELNGSQCGYCTPGIVMAMFALYKNYKNPDRKIIEDALTGNLCRCTGYQPIIDAAVESCNGNKDHFSKKAKEIIALLSRIENRSITLTTSNQTYFQPATIDEALELVQSHPSALLICGSTDIALLQTKKFKLLTKIIDLSRISDLQFYTESDDEITIGAGLDLENLREKLKDQFPAFREMLDVFASQQIRNLATLGGNVGTASPIGDSIPLLMAYQAIIILISEKGQRQFKIEDFLKGYRKTDLRKGEIIHSISIPKTNGNIVRFYKVSKRKDLDISTVSGGFRLKLSSQNVKDIYLAFGGMAEMPKRAIKTEQFLRNKKWTFENIVAGSKILYEEFTPISDARSGAEFRRLAAKNLLIKFYEETKKEYASA